jgi:hypothetical protein
MPKLAGRETIVAFLTSIFPFIKGIEIKQHVVDGDYVATVFDMETINGVDHVIDVCHVVGGEPFNSTRLRRSRGPRRPPEFTRSIPR